MSNGSVPPTNGNGKTQAPLVKEKAERVPRRLVLLADGEDSAVERVLAEYQGAEVSGNRVHEDVQRFALCRSHAALRLHSVRRVGKLGGQPAVGFL